MTNLLFLLISITNTTISASFAHATSSIIPIEINPAVKGVAVNNMTFFLNHTDGHYHLNGLVKNILHLSMGYIDVQLSFQDKQSGVIENDSKSAFFVVGPIDPGVARPFDITTGFTPGQSNLFQHLRALVNIGWWADIHLIFDNFDFKRLYAMRKSHYHDHKKRTPKRYVM